MKILHLMLANFFIDDYSYQENLLTKYHKKMGYEVEVVASLFNFDDNGEGYFETERREYINENQIPVTRLEFKKGIWNKRLRRYKGTYEAIEKAQPDIIFIHGCQFIDIKEVKRYLVNNSNVKVYVDNHADFSNSATNWLSKNILHKIIWRKSAKEIEPFTEMFYGVLPARVDFLKDIYDIPTSKVELLVMGADDEKVKEASIENIRHKATDENNSNQDSFLIVTGGKIDKAKQQVLSLMNVIAGLNDPKVKLIVYGSVIPEFQEEVSRLAENNSIEYIGWINDNQSYRLFSKADLVIFPGRHSVYWEQAVAMGKPIVVKYWEGTTHVDIGGNCIFLYEDTEEEIRTILQDIIYNPSTYNKLLENAQKDRRKEFLYSYIAENSIQ